ncbi:MAG: response regulator [Nitrososphaeraceae archaeon]|jgi:CheY-like chemotaxis protein
MATHKIVLVLDDELDVVAVMKHSLQKHGYHVFGFTDPLLALEHLMINSKDYSLVISDIRMPVMNGLEFVKKVREILPSIKILLMSAFDIKDSQFSKILLPLKVDGCIQKPISLKVMIRILQKIS